MNKRPVHAILVICALIASGCVHRPEPGFQRGQEDARDFILRAAIHRGGSPVATNNLPAVSGPWRYKEDEFGVVIRLPRRNYAQIENFMLTAFGQPKIGPEDTSDGGRYGAYRLTPKGGGLSFSYDGKQTQVIVLRPVSTNQILQRIPEVLKELEQPPRR